MPSDDSNRPMDRDARPTRRRRTFTVRKAVILVAILAVVMLPLAWGDFYFRRAGDTWSASAEWSHVSVFASGWREGFAVSCTISTGGLFRR